MKSEREVMEEVALGCCQKGLHIYPCPADQMMVKGMPCYCGQKRWGE